MCKLWCYLMKKQLGTYESVVNHVGMCKLWCYLMKKQLGTYECVNLWVIDEKMGEKYVISR